MGVAYPSRQCQPSQACQDFSPSCSLTLYLIETSFNSFANRADPGQGLLFASGNMIGYDPTLVDLMSYFIVQCTNIRVYLFDYS